MAQSPIKLVSTDNWKTSICLLIGSSRVVFFIRPDMYHHSIRQLRQWLKDGWYNHTVSQLIQRSDYVEFEGKIHQPQNVRIATQAPWSTDQVKLEGKKMARNIPKPNDAVTQPDSEHTWTLIAPSAQNGLEYQGQRYWHKTADAAIEYAAVIYNANGEPFFELAVVQVAQIVAPKPKVELVSRSFGPKLVTGESKESSN